MIERILFAGNQFAHIHFVTGSLDFDFDFIMDFISFLHFID
jgi:hypothetical protein